jgi:hypothetical protein
MFCFSLGATFDSVSDCLEIFGGAEECSHGRAGGGKCTVTCGAQCCSI